MFFRTLLIGLIIYFAYQKLKKFLFPPTPSQTVKGKRKKRPLDIDAAEIEDAHFRDISDDSSNK